jgi:NAD(P)-dependent dehydrogenase (short-subunit alcohol dehydrogenase family)
MQTVLITGAARRIGRHLAQHFADKGWNVAAHYHTSQEEAQALKDEAAETGGKIYLFEADLSTPHAAEKLFEDVTRKVGLPSLIINNAARFERDDNVVEEELVLHMAVNFLSPSLLIQQLFAHTDGKAFAFSLLDGMPEAARDAFPSYVKSKEALEEWLAMKAPAYASRVHAFGLRLGPTLRHRRESAEHFEKLVEKAPGKHATSIQSIIDAIEARIKTPQEFPVIADVA